MSPVLNIGRFLKTDTDGFLVNECSVEKIGAPWKEAVEEVKQAYLDHLPGKITSLYLRGSIPRGEPIKGKSDLDAFAVTQERIHSAELGWIPQFKGHLQKKYPFVSEVELQFFPYPPLMRSPSFLGLRFTIKILSVCLWGEDLSGQFPQYKPSRRIAFSFHSNLKEEVEQASTGLVRLQDLERVFQVCTWIMKRIVRTGFAILMEKEKRYTRDLYPCYETFAKHYPEKEPEMRKALEWAVDPIADRAVLLDFLESFGKWIVNEAQEKL